MSTPDARSASGSVTLRLGARDEAWDAGSAKKALDPSDYAKAFFWRDQAGDPATLAAYKLPFASPSGGLHAVWAGVTAAAGAMQGAHGGVQLPSSDVAGVRRKIAAYYRKAASQYDDDTITPPWSANMNENDSELRFAVAPVTQIEVRDPTGNDDNTWTMSGYAAVFDQTTTLYDGKFVRLTESIDPKAFNNVLRNQGMDGADGVVHFNFGHDMNRAVAATDVPAGQPGSLTLKADKYGLGFLARVPRDDPDGVAMAAKMRSGVLKQASFAFTIGEAKTETIEQDDGPDQDHRTILDVKQLYDVCATPQGAYSQTVVALRSYAAAIGQPLHGEATPISPTDTRTNDADDGEGGGNDVSPMGGIADLKAQRLQAEVEKARSRYPLR